MLSVLRRDAVAEGGRCVHCLTTAALQGALLRVALLGGALLTGALRAGVLLIALICWGITPPARAATPVKPTHGIAMHGNLKYGPDFRHFDYVNPKAPKGGRLRLGVNGSFDSLNPLIVRGVPAAGLRGYVFESLLVRALDEPFSLYAHIAQSVEVPEDRSWIAFTLNPKARFSDGRPITVDDVIFSHALLRDHGRPNHRFYYAKVAKVEKIGERTVKFTFDKSGDREMALILGLMPIVPRHIYNAETFESDTNRHPVGSGPYVVAKVDLGNSITYRRNPDYWARDLPGARGRFNFDEIVFDYYRDTNALFEAFKKGLIDARGESDPAKWAEAYDYPAAKDGRVIKGEFPIGLPSGMSALVFNTRRKVFRDRRVRQALIRLFDFEWINKNLYYGLYVRTQSYFDRSELSSHGRPASAGERRLLAPYRQAVKPEIMAGTHAFPKTDGSGRNRKGLREALRLLGEAGYELRGRQLVDKRTGKPFIFEVLAVTRSQERLLLSFARALRRAGITMRIRQVDSAIYFRRAKTFDFDMIQFRWPASLSPGNEQTFRWSAKAADTEGTFNYAGVKNPAADAMIAALLKARTRPEFVDAVRALDRVLLSGDYVIPLFHLPKLWLAYWSHLAHPEKTSLYGYQLDTWWVRPEMARETPQ